MFFKENITKIKIISFLLGKKNLKTLSVHPLLFLLVLKATFPTIHTQICEYWLRMQRINPHENSSFLLDSSLGNFPNTLVRQEENTKKLPQQPSSMPSSPSMPATEVTPQLTGQGHFSSLMLLVRQKQMGLQKQVRLLIHQIQFPANPRS